MELIIAEKPELAAAIATALGDGRRENGYLTAGQDRRVVACIGHMLRLLEPEEVDDRYNTWDMDTLPWVSVPWRKKPVEKTSAQFAVIREQIKLADTIVHAGDPDDEGQLIVDEILDFLGCTKPVKRILVNDNNPALIRKAYESMRPNSQYRGLSNAANARTAADLFYGVSMTRAYTLAARRQGYGETLHLGRVQTPILGLAVRRYRENKGHTPTTYQTVTGAFAFGEISLTARYVAKDGDSLDDKGRLINADFARSIAQDCEHKPARIEQIATARKTTPAPLPYNLLKLQVDASRKYKYTPDQTLAITQQLRDKHKLITYNRSDCEYLSEDTHALAPDILAAVAANVPVFTEPVQRADASIKSRAFDSSKVSAHHAIIPTATTTNPGALTEEERRIYMLIARAFVAQFWPHYEYDQTTLRVECAEHRFGAKANVPIKRGWKLIYGQDADADAEDEPEDEGGAGAADLRSLASNQAGECSGVAVDEKKTKPRPRYTMATLLTKLTRVADEIRDPALRKSMVEKDAGKQGEHGGIGTPATRHAIIQNLFDRGYLAMSGDYIDPTAKALVYYDALPDTAKFPDMTAVWHEQQKKIAAGELSPEDFVSELDAFMKTEVDRVRRDGLGLAVKTHPCPTCAKPLLRRKAREGDRHFWACTDPDCKTVLPDDNGAPGARPTVAVSSTYRCTKCSRGLIRRAGKPVKGRPGSYYWTCSGYPDCKQTFPDVKGRPDFTPRKPT